MTEDLKNNKPELSEYTEPSPEPLTPPPSIPKMPYDMVKSSHDLLVKFREAIREGTFQGKAMVSLAQGLMMLDTFIGQSQAQLERAKAEHKEAIKKAREEMDNAGSKVTGPVS